MAKFTEEELKELGIFVPTHAQLLCKRAIKLCLSAIKPVSNEEVREHLGSHINLLLTDTTNIDLLKLSTMSEVIQPLSKVFEDPSGPDAFEELFNNTLPMNVQNKLEKFEDLGHEGIKVVMATGLLALIIHFNAKEKHLISNPLSETERIKTFDVLSEHIRISYEMLLYFDSEFGSIQSKLSRQKGVEQRNRKYNEIHQAYFSYYDANRQRLPSDAECARKFYKSLAEDKKVYRSEAHAVRQLTDKHRKYRKNTTST